VSGDVLPFRPRTPAAAAVVPGEASLHPRTRRAAPAARRLVLEQGAADHEGYARAAALQREQRLLATGRVVPAQITMALDAAGLHGPQVDAMVGAQEPDVDRWELGELQPTAPQLRLLAQVTRRPVETFFEPLPPGPLGGMWMCSRGRGKAGCVQVPPDVVDERGVLLYGGEPRDPVPAAVQDGLFPAPDPVQAAARPPGAGRGLAGSRRAETAREPIPGPRSGLTASGGNRSGVAGRDSTVRAERVPAAPGRMSDADRAQLTERLAAAAEKRRR
jgi:DNA-binding transcriptional regulator YiaG